VRTCYGDLHDVICIRIDATLVTSYSDKECAAGNFKGGWGFHPMLGWRDNTGELLAVFCRPGNAGSNTAADHIAIIDAPIPVKYRRRLLITIDGAGSTHKVIEHITGLDAAAGYSIAYSVGFEASRFYAHFLCWEGWRDAEQVRREHRSDEPSPPESTSP